MLHSSNGQNSQQDYLNGHNSARSAVGVGPMTWDANVAAFAQQYANQRAGDCALQHSGGGGKYGENIAVGSGDFTGAAAVGLWVSEKADYNHNTNTCAAGRVCGHYTQPQDYLNGHNSVRSAVGVGPMTWDDNIAAFAQNYAKQRMGDCVLKRSGGGIKYGENIAVRSGDFTGAEVVGLWASEKPN
ncbi:hypothetical protein RHSIM_Rhsim11G0148300 [Rhododendron simsii]|uniref:SCP domain-containing protein n=1 Tax=Rhododendron simsii TaxID=118357 RepID=A0A834L878_RHOSS|nr:hypothetical protein RHSIM_Rhsim11G0148300 [Rhododendron simsii]